MAVAATTIAEWTGRDVRVGEVLGQLDALRWQGQRTMGARTSVVTLVVRAPTAVDAWDAISTVHRFGGHHPARSIVLVASPDGRPRLDARVALTVAEAAGHQVWFEDVVLAIGGPLADHLDSLVEPFTLPELPVALWYLGVAPDPADRLLRAADAVLVDSKLAIGEEGGDAGDDDAAAGALPHRATLAAIASLFGTSPVVDLAWIRLRPWRELLASLVDGPAIRPLVDAIEGAEVDGKAGARALLGGWLASRLDLPAGALHLNPARHASLRLWGRVGDRAARASVERVVGQRLVRSSADVEGGPSMADVLALPEPDVSWALGQALGSLRRDRVYEAAVRAAGSL